ncbi:MAG: RidA family protein [Candidatus Atabeyarchaeum deiterrae]|jgi:2-iminobutanoate/2-iminopropanoate deaminase
MEKEIITTSKAPKPVGPYSQAVKVGNLIFVSGQIPLDPRTGTPVSGDIKEQTKRVLENIKGILEAEGLTLDTVVKTTVFMRNMADFSKMNDVYATYFKNKPPARTTIQAGDLPAKMDIEIDAIALKSE